MLAIKNIPCLPENFMRQKRGKNENAENFEKKNMSGTNLVLQFCIAVLKGSKHSLTKYYGPFIKKACYASVAFV